MLSCRSMLHVTVCPFQYRQIGAYSKVCQFSPIVYINGGQWACLVSWGAPDLRAVDVTGEIGHIRAEPEIPRCKAVRRLVLELLPSVSRLRRGVLTCFLYLILCMCASPKFVTGGCSVDCRSTCPSRYDATFAIFFFSVPISIVWSSIEDKYLSKVLVLKSSISWNWFSKFPQYWF